MKTSEKIEKFAEISAAKSGYVKSDKERLEVTPWYIHNVFVKGFLKGYKAVTDIPKEVGMKANEYLKKSIQKAIEIHGEIIREASYGGSAFIIFEDTVCYRLNFQAYDNEVITQESQPKKEDKEPDIVEDEELGRAIEIIDELVFLKKHKDLNGKDQLYNTRQPKAWEQANKFLKNQFTIKRKP